MPTMVTPPRCLHRRLWHGQVMLDHVSVDHDLIIGRGDPTFGVVVSIHILSALSGMPCQSE